MLLSECKRAPRELKVLLEEQFRGRVIDVLSLTFGHGYWHATVEVSKKTKDLTGYYTSDDWHIEEVS